MEFRVLGAVEAWAGGSRVDLGSRKQRLVLAILLLESPQPVPMDRIVDLLWPDDPPLSARNTVQALVSRLRAVFRTIPDAPELRTEGAAYVLRVEPGSVDVHRFVELEARAREADDEPAIGLFDEALALWRGEGLTDVASADVAAQLMAGPREERWTALEDRIDAQLRLGRGRDVLAELTALIAAHPLRQRFVGQLMLVLYREGRNDDALDAYRKLRARLADETGLDPSPELQRLEQAILAADSDLDGPREQTIRPAQLPHDVRGFVGRAAELTRLDEVIAAPGTGVDIWVLTGIAGVGKTALAVRWSHRVRDRFPDGQLYLDLRGFDADHEPLTSTAAVTQLLRAVGADPRAIPPDADGQFALWRSLLADKHLLLLLDNARSATQVMPLLPPSGMVLVTSRLRLGDLIARSGARALPVGVLSEEDSRNLLEAVLGDAAVAAETDAAAELARLCGHLPLALRLAAANLSDVDMFGIAEFASELSGGDPLTELSVDGEESAVTTAFALSYRAVGVEHQVLFRRLSLVPGQTFTAMQATALAEVSAAQANQQLKALAAANLIERYQPGRYRFHDLLRLYSARQVLAEETVASREDARRRLFDHYLTAADATGRLLIPHFLRLPRPAPAELFPDTEKALAWLDAEWPNLIAAIEYAAEHGPHEFSWHLADALRAFFHHRGHRTEWIHAASIALTAAQAAGERQPQAAMHLSIALACVNSGRYEEAREHLTTVLRDGLADDWPEGRVAGLNNVSAVHQRLGDPHEAIRCGLEALELGQRQGMAAGAMAMAMANLGFSYEQIGELDEALAQFTQALELAEQGGAKFSAAVLLGDLGNVHRDRDDPVVSAEFYERALLANRELGYQYGEAAALSGRALLTHGDQARADATEAVRLTRAIGDRGTEGWALVSLGEVLLRQGLPGDAAVELRLAFDIAKETSFFWCEASASAALAEASLALDQQEQARTFGERAAKLAAQAGYRLVEARATRLLDQLSD